MAKGPRAPRKGDGAEWDASNVATLTQNLNDAEEGVLGREGKNKNKKTSKRKGSVVEKSPGMLAWVRSREREGIHINLLPTVVFVFN